MPPNTEENASPSIADMSVVSEYETDFMLEQRFMRNKLSALEENIRWLMTSWTVVHRNCNNAIKECRFRVCDLSNKAEALSNQKTFIKQTVSKEVHLLFKDLRQKVCNLEVRVEQLRVTLQKRHLQSFNGAKDGPAGRQVKLCWACKKADHKLFQCPGQVESNILMVNSGTNKDQPLQYCSEIDKQLEKLFRQGIIEPVSNLSPKAIVMALKRSGYLKLGMGDTAPSWLKEENIEPVRVPLVVNHTKDVGGIVAFETQSGQLTLTPRIRSGRQVRLPERYSAQ